MLCLMNTCKKRISLNVKEKKFLKNLEHELVSDTDLIVYLSQIKKKTKLKTNDAENQ